MSGTGDYANPEPRIYDALTPAGLMVRFGLTERQAAYAFHLVASWKHRRPKRGVGWRHWNPTREAVRKAKEQR